MIFNLRPKERRNLDNEATVGLLLPDSKRARAYYMVPSLLARLFCVGFFFILASIKVL
jgi:hypothetical protein